MPSFDLKGKEIAEAGLNGKSRHRAAKWRETHIGYFLGKSAFLTTFVARGLPSGLAFEAGALAVRLRAAFRFVTALGSKASSARWRRFRHAGVA